ncbi:hypothetical protein Tco_1351478 [Tanacetum coccineum]
MSPGTKLGDYIDEFNKLILDLVNIDIEIEDEDQALMLLTSLPSSYENFMETLLYERESLIMEDVLATLNSRELKIRTEGTKEEAGDGLYVRRRLDHSGKAHSSGSLLFKSRGGTGNNRTCTIKGTGKVKIQLHDGSRFILEDVKYVPGLRRSLISLGTLEKEDYTVKMQMGRIKVSNDDAAVAQRRLGDKKLEEKKHELLEVQRVMLLEKEKVKESMKANLGKLLKYNAWSNKVVPVSRFQHKEKMLSIDYV